MTSFVTSLSIYPVKSARGIALDTMTIAPKGALGDREWSIVDAAQENKFLSQKNHSQLATINVQQNENRIILSANGYGEISVNRPVVGTQTEIKMWENKFPVFDAGEEAASWLSSLFPSPMTSRLVYQGAEHFRPTDEHAHDPVNLSDAFPFLLTSESSLIDLNGRMEQPVDMNQFRPNIVINGFSSFDEDYFYQISIGQVRFDVLKACARCKMITMDQLTGEPAQGKGEPLKTLSQFRRAGKGVFFGVYMIPRSEGNIHLGDEVIVHTRHAQRLHLQE